jgi:hypothetical protein
LSPSLANEGIKSLVTEDILKKYRREWILDEEMMNLEKLQKQKLICQFK